MSVKRIARVTASRIQLLSFGEHRRGIGPVIQVAEVKSLLQQNIGIISRRLCPQKHGGQRAQKHAGCESSSPHGFCSTLWGDPARIETSWMKRIPVEDRTSRPQLPGWSCLKSART